MKIYTYKGKKNLCGDRIRIERLKKENDADGTGCEDSAARDNT